MEANDEEKNKHNGTGMLYAVVHFAESTGALERNLEGIYR